MITKTVNEGELLPRGYRAAYANFSSYSWQCAPIGIHLIVRWWHRLHEWSVLYSPSKLERVIIRARKEGIREGSDKVDARIRMLETKLRLLTNGAEDA